MPCKAQNGSNVWGCLEQLVARASTQVSGVRFRMCIYIECVIYICM